MKKILLSLSLLASALTMRADNAIQFFGNNPGPYNLMVLTNIYGRWGNSLSNPAVQSVVWTATTATANPTSNGTPATLTSITVPANSLANNGDTLILQARGTMPAAQANSNQFQVIFGSQTILDSGLQVASNTTYTIEATITRTGATAQHVNARLEWGPGGAVPFAFTNVDLEISQTNEVDTLLSVASTARRQGSHTNTFTRLLWNPTGITR